MRIGRTLPPAAAPLCWKNLWRGAVAMVSPRQSMRTLEDEIRRYFGVRYVFLVSSGTAALSLTLMALRSLSQRSKVVVPAYTCFSVPAAVVKAGLQPALCDIDASNFDFDHALLPETLTNDTLCVISHHLFGVPSDVARTRALCRERGIFVIEDAAQAMGAESNGRKLGTVGDVGIFSLGRGKNITCGAGGIIVTNSSEIAAAVERRHRRLQTPSAREALREFAELAVMTVFIRPCLYWIPAALPFLRLGQTIFPKTISVKRLSGMQAGLLHDWQSRLRQSNAHRSATAASVSRQISVNLPQGPAHPYLRMPILAATPQRRAHMHSFAERRGLGFSRAYPTPINEIPEISHIFDGQRFPSARRVSEHILTIPTHQWISEKDKKAIAECVDASSAVARPAAGLAASRATSLP